MSSFVLILLCEVETEVRNTMPVKYEKEIVDAYKIHHDLK